MIGTKLGPYEITEEIGKGGMATVYRAYQPNMERHVAIKVIRASILREKTTRDRFQREAKLIAKLEHPHLLPVYDFVGEHDPPYIVMRFLEGGTLKQVMASGSVPEGDILYMLRQVASALDYAHRQGIVHRDLKPSNIMIDTEGHAFVADFGIARAENLEEELTGTGTTIGTPGYIAPEQGRGEANVDQRADVYSLGVIIYEMLTGKRPFQRESPLEELMAHLQEPVPDICEQNPELPAEVDQVIQIALAKDKAERYQTAAALVNALASALEADASASPDHLRDLTESFASEQLEALAAQADADIPPTPSDQQRQMTAVYLDVTDFADLLYESGEPDAVHATIDELWDSFTRISQARNGVLESRSGEAGLLLWGREETRESDAEQAIKAALEIQAVIEKEATRRWGENDEPAPFKAGITTGLVLLTRDDETGGFSTGGATITLATRLKDTAPLGSVLISHDTFSHVRGVFSVQQLPAVRMRGRSEPLDVYVAVQARPRAFRLPTRGIEGVETKMIGREADLKILQDALTLTIEDEETQVVTVVGEAGVGKSRLLYEFTNWVDVIEETLWFFQARATQPSMLQPFSLTRDLFSFRFEIADNDPLPVVREKIQQGVAGFLGEASREKAEVIGQLVGFDFSDSETVQRALEDPNRFQQQALGYLGEMFVAASEEYPIFIQVEDIHWADDRSLDLLNNLARENTDLPFFIIYMARPGLNDRRPSWGEGQEFHARITLKPLSRLDSRRLVRELLKRVDKVPTDLRDLIIERMEGNPFYAEELVKSLIDDGVIIKGEPKWEIDMSRLVPGRVPSTLTGVLQARLDRLPSVEQFLLQRASVIGRVFWESAAAHLSASDGVSAAGVAKMLEDLREREMVFKREETSFEGTSEYTFRHAILRDVVYDNIVPRQRRAYHSLAAEWFIEASGDRIHEYAPLVADHFEAAGEPARAAEYLREAGDTAGRLGALKDASRFYEKALPLLEGEEHQTQRMNLQLRVANIYGLMGRYDQARASLDRALQSARRLGDQAGEANALTQLGRLEGVWLGNPEAAREYLDQAMTITRKLDDKTGMIFLLRQLGNVSLNSPDTVEDAKKYLEESIALAREEADLMQEVSAINSLGIAYFLLDDYQKAIQYYQQTQEMAKEMGNLSLVTMATVNEGWTTLVLAKYDRALERGKEAVALAEKMGSDPSMGEEYFLLGSVLAAQGDVDSAESYLREALEGAVKQNIPYKLLAILMAYAALVGVRGDTNTALAWLGLSLTHPERWHGNQKLGEFTLDLVRGDLSDEQVKEAMKKGEKLDLDEVINEILAQGK